MLGKIGLWIVAIALTSCLNRESISAVETNTQKSSSFDLPVYFEKTACFGRCPVFAFEWDGKELLSLNVKQPFYQGDMTRFAPGKYNAKMSPSEARIFNKKILTSAEAASFFTLDSIYDNPMVTDLPSTILAIKGHQVVNRFKGPDLKALYSQIEEQMATFQWLLQE